MLLIRGSVVYWALFVTALAAPACVSLASDDQSAEAAVRALVRAHVEKDMRTMSRMMATVPKTARPRARTR